MHTSDSIWQACVGLGFGGYQLFKGLGLWREKREIQNRPTSKIRSVAMGDAELFGTVKPLQTVKAPFSGKDCVYCAWRVERRVKNDWRTAESGELHNFFIIDDGTGQMLVDSAGAEFYGPETFCTTSADRNFSPSLMLNSSPLSRGFSRVFDGADLYRFREWTLLPEHFVFIEGCVSKVRRVVNGKEGEENIIRRREDGYFIVSGFSEETLLARYGWQVPVKIFGGSAILLACLAYILNAGRLF